MLEYKMIIFYILAALLLLFLLGPRPRLKGAVAPHNIPEDIDDFLEKQESELGDILPDAEKKILWAGKKGERTSFALVNLHGFSACRQEIHPLPEKLSEKFHMNLYMNRMTAHGRKSPEEYKSVTADKWLDDVHEAVEIGRNIGDQIILLCTSTGATLAAYYAYKYPERIAGMIFLSPNFGIQAKLAKIFLLPWGKKLTRVFMGKYHYYDKEDTREVQYWSNPFRSEVMAEVMASIQAAKKVPLEKITIPILGLYTENDETLDVAEIEKQMNRFGSEIKEVFNLTNARKHVLAGDIQSPEMNDEVFERVAAFIGKNIVDS
jgi:esterase/lipase